MSYDPLKITDADMEIAACWKSAGRPSYLESGLYLAIVHDRGYQYGKNLMANQPADKENK